MVSVAVGAVPPSALADPPGDALTNLRNLGAEAEKVDTQYEKAKIDLTDKEKELRGAEDETTRDRQEEAKAKTAEDQFRGRVDTFVDASYQGAQFSTLSSMLTSQSANDFLDRSWALEQLSTQNREALDKLSAATEATAAARGKAEQAQQQAKAAKDQYQQIFDGVAAKKAASDKAKTDAQTAYDRLTSAQRTQLRNDRSEQRPPTVPSTVPPSTSGAAATAVYWASSRVGDPYVWGGSAPGGFDCSGLVMWAYGKAGIQLSHYTGTQAAMGTAVPLNALLPGDLVFYGSASDPHHVSMYVGNGMVVHAPDFGEPVKIVKLENSGRDVSTARRIAG